MRDLSQREFLTRPEVRDIFGIGERLLISLAVNGKVRRKKVGRTYFYNRGDLNAVFNPDCRYKCGRRA